MRSLVVLLLILGLVGCAGSTRPAQSAPTPPLMGNLLPDLEPPKKDKDGKTDPLEQAKYDALRYQEAAKQSLARYELLKQFAYDDALRAQVMWITGVALILAALATIAAVISPVGKKTFVGIAVACGIIAACAQTFREAVPYLPWIGAVLIIGGGLWAAFNWKKLATVVKTASDHGDRLEDWLLNDFMPLLDDQHQEILKATIMEVKEESKKQALLAGTHKELQYLRGKTESLWNRLSGKS